MSALQAMRGRGQLEPVRSRGRWLACGLALQVIGVGIPVTIALRRAHESGVGGAITHYTVRLVWHEMLRSGADVALIVLGVALFVAGAVVLARPFVRRPSTLLVAVPLAALLGLAVLGMVALVCAALFAAAEAPDGGWEDLLGNLPWGSSGAGRGRRRK
jgi:hypothetical protein